MHTFISTYLSNALPYSVYIVLSVMTYLLASAIYFSECLAYKLLLPCHPSPVQDWRAKAYVGYFQASSGYSPWAEYLAWTLFRESLEKTGLPIVHTFGLFNDEASKKHSQMSLMHCSIWYFPDQSVVSGHLISFHFHYYFHDIYKNRMKWECLAQESLLIKGFRLDHQFPCAKWLHWVKMFRIPTHLTSSGFFVKEYSWWNFMLLSP